MDKLYSHVILDFDGVILNSMAAWDEVTIEVFAKTGKHCSSEIMRKTAGLIERDRLEACYRAAGLAIDDQFHDLLEELYRKARKRLCEEPILVEGVLEIISHFQKNGTVLAVVSSTGQKLIRSVFEKFNIYNAFHTIIGFDDVVKHKPDPEPYTLALTKMNIQASDVLVFEDSIPGIQSALMAGCDVVGVSTCHTEERLREAGVRWVISDFQDTRIQTLPLL